MTIDYKDIAFGMLETRFMNYLREHGDSDPIADMLLMARMGRSLKTEAFSHFIGMFLTLSIAKPFKMVAVIKALEMLLEQEYKEGKEKQ